MYCQIPTENLELLFPFYNVWEQVQTLGPRTQSSWFGSLYFSCLISLFLLLFHLLNAHQYEWPFFRATQRLPFIFCVWSASFSPFAWTNFTCFLKSAPWHLSGILHSPKNTRDFIFGFIVVLLWFFILLQVSFPLVCDSHKSTSYILKNSSA